ncbi:MAG: dTMP kinase [Verrucomicrobiota bacterium]|nr:dTMP kinase [Verrucomicrobiota bacterium]
MPFVSFEGSEGCGKSTQVRRLTARLEKLGIAWSMHREPGGTPIGEMIRHILQHAEENEAMTPETEVLLFAASRSQLVREKLRPALAKGELVICDRFFDSTTVYQGVARKLDAALVQTLNAFAVGDCVPDLTILLEVDRATARARMQSQGEDRVHDRMESQPEAFYERVERAYRDLAARESQRILLVDGGKSADAIEQEIFDALEKRQLVRAAVS